MAEPIGAPSLYGGAPLLNFGAVHFDVDDILGPVTVCLGFSCSKKCLWKVLTAFPRFFWRVSIFRCT